MIITVLKDSILYVREIIVKLYGFYWSVKTYTMFLLLGKEGLIECVQFMPKPFIISIVRRYGGTVGCNTVIDHGFIVHCAKTKKPLENLIIGSNVYIGRHNLFDLTEKVIIEDNCRVGAFCQIWTHAGDFTDRFGNYTKKMTGQVIIKKGARIWSRTIIKHGITIGSYAKIGAGSVIIRDIPEDVFAAGNPAQVKLPRVDI